MSQATIGDYGFRLDKAQAGQKVDGFYDQVDSYAADAAIPFGRAVVQGAAANSTKIIDNAANELLGVALFTHAVPQGFDPAVQSATGPASTPSEYKAGDTVNVLRIGRVYMQVAAGATAAKNGAAYAVVAAGASRGMATNADSGNILIGRFLEGGAAGTLVQVELARSN